MNYKKCSCHSNAVHQRSFLVRFCKSMHIHERIWRCARRNAAAAAAAETATPCSRTRHKRRRSPLLAPYCSFTRRYPAASDVISAMRIKPHPGRINSALEDTTTLLEPSLSGEVARDVISGLFLSANKL